MTICTSTNLHGPWKGLINDRESSQPSGSTVESDRGVVIHRLGHWISARNYSQVILKGLQDTIREFSPDIVHLHGPVGALALQTVTAAGMLKVPMVVDNHLCYFNLRPYGNLKRVYYRSFGRFLLPRLGSSIQRFIPLMPDSENVLRRELGVSHEDMTHSTLGVDSQRFNYDDDVRLQTREALEIPSPNRIVGFVGRIDRSKLADVLISSWSRIALETGAYLMLIGPIADCWKQELFSSVPEQLRQRVKFTGLISNEELPGFLSAVDICVWPGDPGISVFQAMACRTAIVSSEPNYVPGVPERGNGATVAREDQYGLAMTLKSMLFNDIALEHMQDRSRQLVDELFDWRVVAERTQRIYEGAITGSDTEISPLW